MDNLRTVKNKFPIIFQCVYDVLEYEKQVLGSTEFLSEAITNLFLGMIEFNDKFIKLAQALDGIEPPKPPQPPAMADVWPKYPPYTEEENFFADKQKDTGEIRVCQKEYPKDGTITGGKGHITCRHDIIKGFTQGRQKGGA